MIIVSELHALGFTRAEILAYDEYVNKRELMQKYGKVTRSDSERTKTYKAEHKFLRTAVANFEYSAVEDCQNYVRQIEHSAVWRDRHAHAPTSAVTVQLTERTKKIGSGFVRIASASYGRGGPTITLLKGEHGGMSQYTIMHEMAHLAGFMHHAAGFREMLLKLVGEMWCANHARSLARCFKELDLKISTDVKIKSPADWLAFSRRAQVARKARFG